MLRAVDSIIKDITGKTGKQLMLYEADLRDHKVLQDIFKHHKIEAVIHVGSLKAVMSKLLALIDRRKAHRPFFPTSSPSIKTSIDSIERISIVISPKYWNTSMHSDRRSL